MVAILCTTSLFAQIDLTGSWTLNSSKSKLGDQFSMAPKTIIIVQKDNNLNVEKHSEWQGQEFTMSDKYTLDGQECVNKGFMDTEKKSTVTWSGDKKSLTVTSKIPMQQGETMTVTEVYAMKDGAMVIESTTSSSFGEMNETQVFDKE